MEGSEAIKEELLSLKEVLSEAITSSSASILEEFSNVWMRIGLSAAQRQDRREKMAVHVSSLLKDILQEEQEFERSIIASLHSNETELVSLCQQLGLPSEEIPSEGSLCEREKTVRNRVDSLNKVKFERQKRLKRIREMESSLCKELGEKSHLPGKSYLPSEEELKNFLQKVENMEYSLDQRRKKHCEMKEHVSQVSAHLELELGEEFAVLTNSTAQLVYSTENMDMLKQTFKKFEEHVKELEKMGSELRHSVESLWERLEIPSHEQQKVLSMVESFRPRDIQVLKEELQRLDLLKRQHMETFISRTRAELKSVWEDCLYGPQQQREFGPAFVDVSFDDDLLSAHESELDRMRGFYLDNQEIFKLVKKREALFQQYCDLEEKSNDPARFCNRGGQLLKDQALKKNLKKELPRVEKELKGVLEQWEEDHERFFMVNDGRYLDTIKLQWNERQASKCTEKVKRQKEKEALTLLEMTYGTKPATPKKRVAKRAAASPLAASAPSKLRRVEQSPLVRPTTTAGHRLPRTAKTRNAKTPVRPIQKRQKEKRKILAEKNSAPFVPVDESFLSSHNFSLASAGSYTDFQRGIVVTSEQQKHTRSSVIEPEGNCTENH